jgi:hypothetical protein
MSWWSNKIISSLKEKVHIFFNYQEKVFNMKSLISTSSSSIRKCFFLLNFLLTVFALILLCFSCLFMYVNLDGFSSNLLTSIAILLFFYSLILISLHYLFVKITEMKDDFEIGMFFPMVRFMVFISLSLSFSFFLSSLDHLIGIWSKSRFYQIAVSLSLIILSFELTFIVYLFLTHSTFENTLSLLQSNPSSSSVIHYSKYEESYSSFFNSLFFTIKATCKCKPSLSLFFMFLFIFFFLSLSLSRVVFSFFYFFLELD